MHLINYYASFTHFSFFFFCKQLSLNVYSFHASRLPSCCVYLCRQGGGKKAEAEDEPEERDGGEVWRERERERERERNERDMKVAKSEFLAYLNIYIYIIQNVYTAACDIYPLACTHTSSAYLCFWRQLPLSYSFSSLPPLHFPANFLLWKAGGVGGDWGTELGLAARSWRFA